jgi:hypothetical protein
MVVYSRSKVGNVPNCMLITLLQATGILLHTSATSAAACSPVTWYLKLSS